MIWCYNCSKQTTLSPFAFTCALCGSAGVQQCQSTVDDVSQFTPYVIGQQQQPYSRGASLSSGERLNGRPSDLQAQEEENEEEWNRIFGGLLSGAGGTIIQTITTRNGERIIRIITSVNMNQENNARPLTKQSIEKLQRVNQVSQCSICQETENTDKNGFRLKCCHEFHEECLMPWPNRRIHVPHVVV